ncbi:ARM repeat-containing protein [Fistulina hepatica ATCC 64428]|uniref:ARM repeat-containing protein n=1 Tax=Fistulina hepatica ATCC 64428 TaxID=1128425 RepID=A0A0D7AGZ1_9AGAR|nr:ARM repeat-containing protein [Fistulina hepatica ATCC 64428]
MAEVNALMSALDVFSRVPDKAEIERANAWLQDFQHSSEAWTTCNAVLHSPDTAQPLKLFAAQTLRSKVTYDLSQVPVSDRLNLRDTLIAALASYQSGPTTIIVQLSLALAGLAMQVPAWTNPVQTMIDAFAQNPSTVPILLQFLTLLPEEVDTNTRIPVTDEEYQERSTNILSGNSAQILNMLSMYIQAPGVTHEIQNLVFRCLRNWIIAGEALPAAIADTPLFAFAFQALSSDQLFDSAVEVICEMIHETQEVQDNMRVIELILPRVIALKPRLKEHYQDSDKLKGYARIFSEAGETYRILIVQHPESFFPLVDAIGECSAHPDLDIVPVTFPFWDRLAQMVSRKPDVPEMFIQAYTALLTVIIRHLHFPPDGSQLVGQELEDFRSFRHVMGDTLKDCCTILGAEACLMAVHQMIAAALASSTQVSWQDIEAPLFAMRSMGGEVSDSEAVAVPKVLQLIPLLPDHPRVRYAALLIIGRYTSWIDKHPEYIPSQLQYISTGFEDNDIEVCAAAGHALRFFCEDCKRHLVDFLPTLHQFLNNSGPKLAQDDRREVYTAIAHVVSAMPMDGAGEALKTFAFDILRQIHTVTTQALVSKEELQTVCDGLENLEAMLAVIGPFGDELPPACQNTCQEAWAILDGFQLKYGNNYRIVDRATRVIRHGITLFGDSALPVASSVVARMSLGFESTAISGYLWIAAKCVQMYGSQADATLLATFRDAFERSTAKLIALLQTCPPEQMPDVLEDYLALVQRTLEQVPEVCFKSSAFALAFRASMSALTIINTETVYGALDFYSAILAHDCLSSNPAMPSRNYPLFAAKIEQVVKSDGHALLNYMLNGLVGDFPPDGVGSVVTVFRSLAEHWPAELLSWLPSTVEQLKGTPVQSKQEFLQDASEAIRSGQPDRVKYAILGLNRASRKARERRRELER